MLALASVVATSAAAAAATLSIPLWHGGSVPAEAGDTVKTWCANAVAHVSVCKGAQCSERTYPCNPYACAPDGLTCESECESDAQCSAGGKCNVARGECSLFFAVCSDPWSRMTPDGQTSTCKPYRCVAGSCQQQCVKNSDCWGGGTCVRNANGRYSCQGGTP